ncbi:CG13064 [Drosophila busckii]|uniref:CG13064 n=1 Tax=Drosophila busckii TaxID=30019 RepID=A0A0M4EE17_DROBS|nr:CG13064 [Drosophila busckii]
MAWINPDVEAAALIYHAPSAVVYHHPADIVAHEQHPGYTIVAPLTKIAHVTYDSVPISHSPYEHVPLFQRIGHVKGLRVY